MTSATWNRVLRASQLVLTAGLLLAGCEFLFKGGPTAAQFGANPSSGDAPLTVTFDWIALQIDQLAECIINPGDGSPAYRLSDSSRCLSGFLEHTYLQEGEYHPSFRVIDKNGVSDSRSTTVRVSGSVPLVTLTITLSGTGLGTVREDVSERPRIDCDITMNRCSVQLVPGTTFGLAARSEDGSEFIEWSGDCSGNEPMIQVNMSADKTCDARFDDVSLRRFTLTVTISGNGSGTVTSDPAGIDCESDCEEAFLNSTIVTLKATPAPGSLIADWRGDCLFTGAEYELWMTEDRACEVVFSLQGANALTFRDSIPLPDTAEANVAATLDPTGLVEDTLVVVGFDQGDITTIDISDPANPQISDTTPFLCGKSRSVITTRDLNGDDIFVAFSTDFATLCSDLIPPSGFPENANIFGGPGGAAAIPGTDEFAYANFGLGSLQFDSFAFDSTRPDISLSGAERSCPFSVVATADRAYVVGREGEAGTSTESCNDWRKLFIVDLVAGEVIATVDLGAKPRGLALSPDGSTVFVADFEDDAIYVIDVATETVTETLPVGDGPTDVDVTADGAYLAVTNWNANAVQLIDLADGSVVATEDSRGEQPVGVEITADDATVIVTNFGIEGAATKGSVTFFELNLP